MKKTVLLICLIFLFQACIASALNQSISLDNQNTTQANICSTQNANYVIITTTELEDAVQEFKTWKEYPSFSVEIVTIQWISDNYNGVDLPEHLL